MEETPAPRPPRDSWSQVSSLLDVAMELAPEARAAWLASLTGVEPGVVSAVAGWLGEFDLMQSTGFLEERLDQAMVESAGAGLQVGAYRLVEPIGQGGMGTVWLAERNDGQFAQRAAVKLLNAALLGSHAPERFAREAGILARLTHPQIAHLLDAGLTPAGTPYLVLEHVAGEHVDRHADGRRLDVPARLRLFLDVLTPVAHAHANLVVHRDLKLSNVLVTDDGHVKLLDFGIAKLLQADAVRPPTIGTYDSALTPACAAPEQLTGGDVTTRTDVYALGVLLYQLLTGRHPSADGVLTPAALIRNVVDQAPPKASDAVLAPSIAPDATAESLAAARAATPARLRQALEGDLDTILATALKKDPAEKYQTVSAMADDLRRHLRDEPIAARPDSLAYRAGKFVRRHRAPVTFAALALLALVAGLAGTVWQSRRATAQALRADEAAVAATAQRDFARRQLARADALNDLNAFLIADAAPLGATFTARDLLARAERTVSNQRDDAPDVRVELLVSIGRLYSSLGETTNAGRTLTQAYELSRDLADPSVRAQAACGLAPAIVHTGDPARARRLLEEGQAELPDDPQYAAARIACHLAAVAVDNWAGDGNDAVDHARAAHAVAAGAGALTPLMESRIGMDLAESLRNAGRFVEADAAFADVYARLEALGRADTERAGTVLNNWGLVLNALGKPRQAELMFRRSVAISAEGAEAARVDPVLWNNLAQAVFDQGRIDEAIALSTRAHEEAVRAGNAIVADQAMLVRARYHVARGQLELGERLLNDVEARFKAMFPPTHAAFMAVGMDRARLAQERGDWAGARTLVDQVAAIDEAAGRGAQPPVLRRRAVLRAHFGQFGPARQDAERALAIAVERVGEGNRASTVGIAYLTLGDVLAAEGRSAQARTAFQSAVEHFDATVDPAQPDLVRARTLARR